MTEIWKEVPQSVYYLGIMPNYEASNLGRIRNSKTGRILKYSPSNGDYNRMKVQLRNKYEGLSLRVAYVIWETFRSEDQPSAYEKPIYFKDGNNHNFAFDNLSLTKV